MSLGHYPQPHLDVPDGRKWREGTQSPAIWVDAPAAPRQIVVDHVVVEMGEEVIWGAPAPRKTRPIMSPRRRIIADLAEVYPDVGPEVVFAVFHKHSPRGQLPTAQNGAS